MASCAAFEESGSTAGAVKKTCLRWCVTAHGMLLGEEDWIHTGEPIPVAERLLARMAMSIDPGSGATDGPHILIGTAEYTLSAAKAVAASITELTDAAG
jgi:hypothetical protein